MVTFVPAPAPAQIPFVTISAESSTVPVDGSVLLTATASGGTGTYIKYAWYLGGTPIPLATKETLAARWAGSYTVVVTDSGHSTSAVSPAVELTLDSGPHWPQYATWLSGSSQPNQYGSYGVKGAASPTNLPGSRGGGRGWRDSCGQIWYYGGYGYARETVGYLDDLWKWDGTSWTWVSGSDWAGWPGNYPSFGTMGVPSPTNSPGARRNPGLWTTPNGDVYLFGGATNEIRNDLWRWDGAAWTWMNGPTALEQGGVYGTRGVAALANVPGSRVEPATWTDSAGNLWLFGGFGFDAVMGKSYMNDLWKWDGSAWTWVAGSDRVAQPGAYGQRGVPAPGNTPGARTHAAVWQGADGQIWLFGGEGYGASDGPGFLNDLWVWDGANWTWVAGPDSINSGGSYGVRGVATASNLPPARRSAVSWVDRAGTLWLFSGSTQSAQGPLNDLWMWDGLYWTWVGGSEAPAAPTAYGLQGFDSPEAFPGNRHSVEAWTDGADSVWLFGGFSSPLSADVGTNELWLLHSDSLVGPATRCGGSPGGTYAVPDRPGVTYSWDFSGSGATIIGSGNQVNVDFSTLATSGTLSVRTANSCGTSITRRLAVSVTSTPLQPVFSISRTQVHGGETDVRYEVISDPTASYIWSYSGTGVTIRGSGHAVALDFSSQATSGTLSVLATNACGSSAPLQLSIAVTTVPSVSISTESSTVPVDGSVLLTATASGGTGTYIKYAWYLGGTPIPLATNATLAARWAGSYTVAVTDSGQSTSAVSPAVELTLASGPHWPQYATWLSGSSQPNQYGSYGVKGAASPTNLPGSRGGGRGWRDSCGQIWYYGGYGHARETVGYLDDLWKWDGTNWTWVSGTDWAGWPGNDPTYGTMGVPSPTNSPGARRNPGLWTTPNGDVYLFGGATNGIRNDLWRWDGAAWTWMNGPTALEQGGVYGTRGVAAPTNVPGSRVEPATWTDSAGNLWLFGGYGIDAVWGKWYMNDLWKWDGSAWTWMAGSDRVAQPGIYGQIGVPAPENIPGARSNAAAWQGVDGRVWLFGGGGFGASGGFGYLNDLWVWDGANWTWIAGPDSIGSGGSYGVRGVATASNLPPSRVAAASWVDRAGTLWLFGGGAQGAFNDLWKWDGLYWTWMGGSEAPAAPTAYGFQGFDSPEAFPGNRHSVEAWTDGADSVWLFGGFSSPLSADVGTNELWLLHSDSLIGPATRCGGSQSGTYAVPDRPGVTYSWDFSGSGATIVGSGNQVNVDFSTLASSGTLSVQTANSCGTSVTRRLAISVTAPLQPVFSLSRTEVHAGESDVRYEVISDPTASYVWSYSGTGVTIRGSGNAVDLEFSSLATSGTLTVLATNACGSSATLQLSIAVATVRPSVSIFAESGEICGGGNTSLTATAAGGTGSYVSHQWSLDGEAIPGASLGTYLATRPGAYTVTVTDSSGWVSEQSSPVVLVSMGPLPPTSWWRADGNTVDSAGGISATLTNGASFAPGRSGQAFALDGIDDYVSLGSGDLIGSGNWPFTASLWIRPNAIEDSSAFFAIRLRQDSQFFLVFTHNHPDTGGGDYVWPAFRGHWQWASSVDFSSWLGNWVHIAVSYNGGNKDDATSFSIFINGQALPTEWIDFGPAGGDCNDSALGSNAWQGCDNPSNLLNGLIDEVQIYRRALSSAEVLSLYQGDSLFSASPTQSIPPGGTTAVLAGTPPISGATGVWSIVSGGTGTFSPDPSSPNATFTHTGGTGPIVLRWTVSTLNCVLGSADVTVIVPPACSASITPSGPTTFCQGGHVTLNASAAASYLWSTGATSQFIVVSSSGSYTATTTSASGCSATSDPFPVTVLPLPDSSVSSTSAQSSVTLTASPAVSYLWSTGQTSQSITVTQSGSYSVLVTGPSGCSASSSPTSVTVVPPGQNTSTTSGNVTTTFEVLDTGGPVTVTPITPAQAGSLPTGYFQLAGTGTAYEISTGAQYSGSITISFQLSGPLAEPAFNSVQVLHGENGQLVDRTSGRDYATLTVYATVTSLSPFVLATVRSPAVTSVVGPVVPTAVGTAVSVAGSFTDPDLSDTHTAVWTWGDGTTSAGTVTESSGSGTVTGQHTYVAPGVYTVQLTVSDASNGSSGSTSQFVVVYDPNGGFVTGGGWIDSPAGAYTANPALTGKATFGFVSKYENGRTVPSGNTEFQFQAARFKFKSTSYEWLVISGAKAQYKGLGTVNGSGSYAFILTAVDGDAPGGHGVDQFRLKVYDQNQGNGVIYDNNIGAPDTADPTAALGGGSIVIHREK